MKSDKTGGPAFPIADFDHQSFHPKNTEELRRLLSGMTLRDYFAAKAMQAMANEWAEHEVARRAYMMAEAMIEVRKL